MQMIIEEIKAELTDDVKLDFLKKHGIEINIKDLKSLEQKITCQVDLKTSKHVDTISKHYCQIPILDGLMTSLVITNCLIEEFAKRISNENELKNSATLNASISLLNFQRSYLRDLKMSQIFTNLVDLLKFKNFDTGSMAKN